LLKSDQIAQLISSKGNGYITKCYLFPFLKLHNKATPVHNKLITQEEMS